MNNDIFKLLNRDIEPFAVTASPINTIYRAIIDDDFREVKQFADIVDVLDSAQEGDLVHIRLSTNGGALHSIIPLLHSMENTLAHVHIHVESDTASAGTMLMMKAHSVYINPYTTIMIHTASYGYAGHSGNMEAHVAHNTKSIEKLVRELYKDFLTEAEILRVLDGKEIYLTDEDCFERFKLREEIRGTDECTCGKCESGGEGVVNENPLNLLKSASDADELYKMPDEVPPLTGIDAAWDDPKPKKPRKKTPK